MTTLTTKQLATLLNGREYGSEITKEENLVSIFEWYIQDSERKQEQMQDLAAIKHMLGCKGDCEIENRIQEVRGMIRVVAEGE